VPAAWGFPAFHHGGKLRTHDAVYEFRFIGTAARRLLICMGACFALILGIAGTAAAAPSDVALPPTGASALTGSSNIASVRDVQLSRTADNSGDHAAWRLAPGSYKVALNRLSGFSPAFSVSPTSKAYGTQQVATTSTSQTFTVTNTGSADLAITTASLTEAHPGQFTKGTDTCTGASVAPNDTCTVQVSFTPTSAGIMSADLGFTTDAAGSPHDVALTGTGTAVPASHTPGHTPTCEGIPATIVGTPGDDELRGTNGPDVIVARKGKDYILGFDGDDLICGGRGNDQIRAGYGDDKVLGKSGNDLLFGFRDDDTVRGGVGDDLLRGGGGDDALHGGPGHDLVVGHSGQDQCTARSKDQVTCE
jgi:Ca2+-binding RTX toxin-like protein